MMDYVTLSFRVPASTMKEIARETYEGSIWMYSFLCVSEFSSGVLEVSSSTDLTKPRQYDLPEIRCRLSNARSLG